MFIKQSQGVYPNSAQSQTNSSASEPNNKLVNTQDEQYQTLNPQDLDALEISKQESEQKEKGYKEGTRNDTDEKTQTVKPF